VQGVGQGRTLSLLPPYLRNQGDPRRKAKPMQSLSRTVPAPGAGQLFPRIVFTLVLTLAFALPSWAGAQEDEGAGPDDNAVMKEPSRFQGSWRVVARDDIGNSALMVVSLQHSVGEAEGTGDYALLQPFCDAVAGQPITGRSDCELDGGGVFDRVTKRRRWLVLVFRPTADGYDHTLAVRLKGDRMVGEYRNTHVVLPIVLQRVP